MVRITPIYKIYRAFWPFGRGSATMVINHLRSGMILQVWAKSTKAKTITYLPGTRNKTSQVELKSRKFQLVTIVSKLIFFCFLPISGVLTIYSKGDSNPYTTQSLSSSRTSQQTCILVVKYSPESERGV